MNPKHPEQDSLVSFDAIVSSIVYTDAKLSVCAAKAVNQLLTLRNWLIGFYIAHYELNGSDRAEYGENLLAKLSTRLKSSGVSNTGKRQRYNYLRFFQFYPQMAVELALCRLVLAAKWIQIHLIKGPCSHEKSSY